MPTLAAIPLNLPTGLTELGPFNVPNNLTTMRVELGFNTPSTPTFWPNVATTLAMDITISYDGGTTYEFLAGITAIGGVHLDEGGVVPFTDLIVGPARKLPGRKLKVRCTVGNGPLVTQAKVEVF